MTGVSAGRLTVMRAQRLASFQATCDVMNAVESADAVVGRANAWTVTQPALKCSVMTGPGTVNSGGVDLAMQPNQARHVCLPWGTAINPADRIRWNGFVLEVVSKRPEGDLGVEVAVECVDVTGENP